MIDIEFSTIAFTIINLIVLFLLLKKFLIGPLNDVIKKREDMIAGTISDANNQKAEAMKLKSQYEDTLAGVDAECRDLREKSRVEAQNEYSRIIDQADAKSVKMIKDAEEKGRKKREEKEHFLICSHRSQSLQWQQPARSWAVKVMRNQQELPCMTSF